MLSGDGDQLCRWDAAILAEMEGLAHTLATARVEIAALGADDITASHIPSATDELDAIVAHTATATENILECCERIDDLSARLLEADSRILQGILTRVYEACSFQDITGQRIMKVVATLKTIETKVSDIMGIFGPLRTHPDNRRPLTDDSSKSLLNGPQLPLSAMDQADIDVLLASFD